MNIPESLIKVAEQPVKLFTLTHSQAFKLPQDTADRLIEEGWWPAENREVYLASIFVMSSTPSSGYSTVGAFNISQGEMCGFGTGDFDVLPVEIVIPSAS